MSGLNITDFDSGMGSGGVFSGASPTASSGLEGINTTGANAELQEFIAMEQQKQQLRATIQNLTDTCWEKCVGNPGSRLDSKTEACLENCVHRFFDVTVMIANRFATALQRQGGM